MNQDDQSQVTETNGAELEQGQVQSAELGDQQTANAESSPASDAQHEQSNGVQERINKITAQKYAEKNRADALEKELQELRNKQSLTDNKPADVSAPELPSDIYDEEAMRAYHASMLEYNRKIAESSASSFIESQKKQQLETRQQQEATKTFERYASNALKSGITEDKIVAAGQALNNAGITPELGNYIMNDPNGGQIAAHLHDNPALMYEVLNMSPTQAAVKIATEIKPQAISTTPKVTNAPDPLPEIQGSGVEPKDDFEAKNPNTVFI